MRLVGVRAFPRLFCATFAMVTVHTHALRVIGLVFVWTLDNLAFLNLIGSIYYPGHKFDLNPSVAPIKRLLRNNFFYRSR